MSAATTLHELDSDPSWANLKELERLAAYELPHFYRQALRLLGNVHDAEDAVQDALVSAHKNLTQFRGKATLSAWFTAIVTNAARMQRCRRCPIKSLEQQFSSGEQGTILLDILVDYQPGPEEVCANSETRGLLLKAIDQLSPVSRRALHLYYIEDINVAEASEMLGVAEGTIKAQLARARAKLAKVFPQS